MLRDEYEVDAPPLCSRTKLSRRAIAILDLPSTCDEVARFVKLSCIPSEMERHFPGH